MIWRGSANLGEVSDLFTGVLFNNYGPPPGFCFDILCADEPMIDDRRSRDYNIDRRVSGLFNCPLIVTKKVSTFPHFSPKILLYWSLEIITTYYIQLRTFFEYIERQSMNYRTNNVITTFGGDFTYMDANVYFKNLDKLIRYNPLVNCCLPNKKIATGKKCWEKWNLIASE